jgi:threonine/homoserine/homoserine lactone efflux protein
MPWQLLCTVLLVAGCSAYALWALMPGALRRRLRAATGARAVADAGACGGCGGCGTRAAQPGAPQVVHILRRPPAS